MENGVRRKLAKEVADFYEKEGSAFSSKRTQPWNLMGLLTDRLKSGDLLVDIGAGNCRLADVIPSSVRYLGVEPSNSLRKEAQGRLSLRNNGEVVAGSLPKLDLQESYADAIACIAVLHHIPSQEMRTESIIELHRILKPGGLMLLTVWNPRAIRFFSWNTFKNAWLRLRGVKGGEPGDLYYPWKASGKLEERYVHAFTLSEFKSLFKPALWSIKKIGAYDKESWCSWIKGRNLVALVMKK
ncbi:MAG: class I SAM-dependent methyltransferase [Patescibacteria group bacterium]|nr:class I SAM-dependent methyltransferase [Patescibacteria group bacterium]